MQFTDRGAYLVIRLLSVATKVQGGLPLHRWREGFRCGCVECLDKPARVDEQEMRGEQMAAERYILDAAPFTRIRHMPKEM